MFNWCGLFPKILNFLKNWILSFILSLQVLFYDFKFYFVFKLVFLTLKTFE